jgi:hypothetical protein
MIYFIRRNRPNAATIIPIVHCQCLRQNSTSSVAASAEADFLYLSLH